MPTVSVSSSRVSELIKHIDDGTLVPKPSFQRRLVWTNIVKDSFLETVKLGLPFPEIFIATGKVDTETMTRTNLLVDGQQRVSTLREYVQGAKDLVLKKVVPYAQLSEDEKKSFLDYSVAVRDLGTVTTAEIKEIFSRINSTDYALKAMERLNAQFSGDFKTFCENLSQCQFFQSHSVFSMAAWRRMKDIDFCVNLIVTMMSTYYHRDALNAEYLRRYNDSFPKEKEMQKRLDAAFQFIEGCKFDKKCRIWKRTDLFTAIIEIDAILQRRVAIDQASVNRRLSVFYGEVDKMFKMGLADNEIEKKASSSQVFKYLKAATKATNDKYSRVVRADIISGLLMECQKLSVRATKKAVGRKKK